MAKKYILIKTNSKLDLFIHIGIVVSLIIILTLGLFTTYLPAITHHRETVTVPDVVGMNVDEMKAFLEKRDLDFRIRDSSFSRKHDAFIVLTQSPEPGAKVKTGRKLILTINPKNPPKVKVPNLESVPFKSAEILLKNMDLNVGKIKYKHHIAENAVLEMYISGWKKLPKDSLVPKGTRIDLKIADGVGETEFSVPDVKFIPLDEAEFIIKGHNLYVGNIRYVYNSTREIGTVLKQVPDTHIGKVKKGVRSGSKMDDRERNKIRAGEIIDLWVAGNADARPEEEELTAEEQRIRDSLERNINERSRQDLERILKKEEEKKKKPKE